MKNFCKNCAFCREHKIKTFTPSTSEIVIEYESMNGVGKIIIDSNCYLNRHKQIMKSLQDCNITAWYQRAKEYNNET